MKYGFRKWVITAVLAGGAAVAGDFDEVRLQTRLAGGPLGGLLASGSADFRLRPSRGDKSFSVEVEDLNLPAGTTLQVWVNNEPVGRLVVSGPPARGGEIELVSRDGATVPKLEAGDIVSIRNNAGTLLSGVMQRRPLDDSPITATPTAAVVVPAAVPDDKKVLRTPLTGGGLAGVRPSGEVEFRDDRLTGSSRLFVEVNDVNLREGTEVEVEINGRRMGRIRLQGGRRGGELELDSRNGERIDRPRSGDLVRVIGPAGPILTGALQERSFGDDRRSDDSSTSSTSTGNSSSTESRVQSPLAGGAIGGVRPSGAIDFRVRQGGDQKLNVEVEHLNLPAGTVLNVYVGDAVVGRITVGPPPMRGGELEISTRDGGTVPAIAAGAVVSVRNAAGGVLLTGVVQAKSFTEVPPVPGTTPTTTTDDPKGPNSGSGNSNSGSGNSNSGHSNSGSGNSGSGSGNSGSGSSNSGSGNSNSGSGNSNNGSSNSNSGSGNSGSGSSNSGSGSSNSGSGNSNSGSGNSGSGSGNSGSGNSNNGSGNSNTGSGNSGSGSSNSGSGSSNSGSGNSNSGSGNSGSGSGNSGSGSSNSGSGNSNSGSGNSGSGSGNSGSGSGNSGSGKK